MADTTATAGSSGKVPGVSATRRRKNAPTKLPDPSPTPPSESSDEVDVNAKLKVGREGGIKITAPGTPFDEISLTSSLLQHIKTGKPPRVPLRQKRRVSLLAGGLIGILLSYVAFLNTKSYHGHFLQELETRLNSLDIGLPSAASGFSGISGWADLPKMLNMSDLIAPSARKWLENRDFKVGREVKESGAEKVHAVALIPGVISSGLESWGTDPDSAQFFRKRVWGGGSMVQAIVTRKQQWLKVMALDAKTGLDPTDGTKVRSSQGLDAASSFITGYWIWAKIIEMAVLDYDYNDLSLQAYDWRLAYINLQHRDSYFSRLKATIEHNKEVLGKKTVLVTHSMGGTLILWFMKWVEADGYGGGGNQWVDKHIDSWVNIGGTLLGVPKAMGAFLSGEMRDTVDLNPAGVYMLEKLFSRQERAKLFRTWAGAASMLLKGGNDVWGDENGAPDDADNATLSQKHMFLFKSPSAGSADLDASNVNPNLTLNDAIHYLQQHTTREWQQMVATNFSLGFERSEKQLKKNNKDHSKWSNPLEVQLPKAPSMKIYCLYGWGKPTERGYFYSRSDTTNMTEATENESEHGNGPSKKSWIDYGINLDNVSPSVRAGVINGEGDGTVSLLSNGAMCVDGWQRKLYNPAGIKVITAELKHEPQAFDPRGGEHTGDHIDILGSTFVNEAVLNIVSGRGHLVNQTIHSDIVKYASKIKWEV